MTEDRGPKKKVISARAALEVAAEELPKRVGGGLVISAIKLFYYGPPSEADSQELVPAWGFEVDSLMFYVDAFTGEFLD